MGAGLSMASVNKIKELANSREYSLALELVEHQDLTKSLNPQFLRLCGEIYIKNDRYKDARRCLIMAHRLGPESKRILYTFVELYLRMGYFQLAKTYYDMYMFDANAYDSRDMEYVWNKHEHADNYTTLEPLIAGYAHNLDYDWSFELYLLYKKEGKQSEAAALAELYHASFKNSDNSRIIQDIESGKEKVDTYFNVYPETEAADNDPDMEELRTEEQELLAADDLRMHPKEAEITIMYEDSYTPAGSEKKVQKMLKKQEREEQRKEKKLLKKQKQQEKAEAAATAETEKNEAEVKPNAEEKPATEEKSDTEVKASETVVDEKEQKATEETTVTEQKATEETSETEAGEPEKEKKKGFFQRWKKKKHEEESEEVASDEAVEEKKEAPIPETTDAVEEKTESGTTDIEETKETTSESEDAKPSEEPKESNSDISSEIAETTGQAEDMRHRKGTIAKDVVVVDEDDGFEAEADTIEELASKEHVTQETETKEAEATTAKKPTFEFQTVELAPEDFDEEYEVDDFSETVDDEFGEMKMPEPKPEMEKTEAEEETEEVEVVEPEPEVESEPEPEVEEAVEEVVEEEPEIEETVEEPEPEIEEPVEETVGEEPEAVEPESEETVEEPEPEIEEPVAETVEEEPEAVEPESEETVEEPEPEIETPVEETVEEEPEAEEEIEEPEVVEPEPEIETEAELEIEKPEAEPKEEFHVAPFTTKPEKKKLDFPVFKSSLFPDYHKEVKAVENHFNEIMEEAQDKMTENMQKEEQMQREAEALLASLGISMDSIPTTPKAENKEEQPVQKGPSRDELKASLKIDSVKKNLLKRVKEYR